MVGVGELRSPFLYIWDTYPMILWGSHVGPFSWGDTPPSPLLLGYKKKERSLEPTLPKKYIRKADPPLLRSFVSPADRDMATRQSRRLRGAAPEISPSFTCFVCRDTEFTCANTVERLSCCNNFVHRRCQRRWIQHQITCGLCRQPLVSTPTTPTFRLPVTSMTRLQIIQRLEDLLESDELQQHIEEVSVLFLSLVVKPPS